MTRTNVLVTLFLSVALILFSSRALAVETPASSTPQYLFVMTSDSGTLKHDKKLGVYILKVNNTYPWVTYFAISPDKKTGIVSLDKFPKIFSEIDKEKNNKGLNSALVAKSSIKNDLSTYAFTLVSMTYEKQKNIIKFVVKILPGKKTEAVPDTVNLKHIALFIDEGCGSCGGAGI